MNEQSRGIRVAGMLMCLSLASCAELYRSAFPPGGQSNAINRAVEKMLDGMSIDEKLGQLTQVSGGDFRDADPQKQQLKQAELLDAIRAGRIGSMLDVHGAEYTNSLQAAAAQSRSRIPLIFGFDTIHGYRTIFPIPLAEASSWDPQAVETSARVAATEARAAGIHWTFAPMVDIARDPRWGRIAEGAGEDPYLGSVMAAARVRGFQGRDLAAADSVLACAKHFVAYGGAEGGRDYNTVDISERTLRDVYLPPFKAAVDAGVGSVMSAFNEIGGVPASANSFTMNRILRGEWGFDGFVVSDWTAIKELIQHGSAVDLADAARKSISAGVDMDMVALAYRTHLADAVRRGLVPAGTIDDAVRRVLRAKSRLGFFEPRATAALSDPKRERDVTLCAEHRRLARDVARRSIVLLKNERRTLPLSSEIRTLAVIGPLADNQHDPLGCWSGRGRDEDVVSVLSGLRARGGGALTIRYAKGCDLEDHNAVGIADAAAAARASDAAIVVVGEGEALSGEAHSRSTLDLPGVQEELVRAVHATGVPTIVVLMNGRPLSIGGIADSVPAIVEAWHLGVECGHAVADVLFGDFNPSGKLPVTFPRSVGQIPIYYNHKNTGRPPSDERYTSKYVDLPSTPLYPFGWGLSYTQFAFENLRVTPARMPRDGRVEITVDVRNTGDRDGVEVAQLYVQDVSASVTRPVRELKGFQSAALRSGEMKSVRFELAAADLRFYDGDMKYTVEPGGFQFWVGPNSTDGPQGAFEVIR